MLLFMKCMQVIILLSTDYSTFIALKADVIHDFISRQHFWIDIIVEKVLYFDLNLP